MHRNALYIAVVSALAAVPEITCHRFRVLEGYTSRDVQEFNLFLSDHPTYLYPYYYIG